MSRNPVRAAAGSHSRHGPEPAAEPWYGARTHHVPQDGRGPRREATYMESPGSSQKGRWHRSVGFCVSGAEMTRPARSWRGDSEGVLGVGEVVGAL